MFIALSTNAQKNYYDEARSRVGDISSAISSAAQKLGFSQLKPEQKSVVEVFLKGRDVFVSLPTGNGKSLRYSILPNVFARR